MDFWFVKLSQSRKHDGPWSAMVVAVLSSPRRPLAATRRTRFPYSTAIYSTPISFFALTFICIYVVTTFTASAFMSAMATSNPLVVATRLHLGHASHPPSSSQLYEILSSFDRLAVTVGADHAVIAVDADEKFEGFDLIDEVAKICKSLRVDETHAPLHTIIHVLPVTPWGKFVPALNAIVSWSAKHEARYLLLASAEVQLTKSVIEVMKQKFDVEKTLVVGTVLPGHEYKSTGRGDEVEVALTGRTTPWNTNAIWNVPKLALTGFLLISEGLHPDEDGREGASGVEEVCTIATLQRILQPNHAQAKLVSIPGATWGQDFENDEKRKEWHEKKMMSKYTRAKKQLDLLGLSGTVTHC